MPSVTGTSVGNWKIARKQTLTLYQIGDFGNFRRQGGFRARFPLNKGVLAKKASLKFTKTSKIVS